MLKQPNLSPRNVDNKYELTRDYALDFEGLRVVVPRFFMYDGASIPAPAWQLTYTPFNPDVMLPALIHDWIYYNHQIGQADCDDLFYALLRENGVSQLKASAMWGAVRTAGGFFWDNDDKDEAFLKRLWARVKSRPQAADYRFPAHITR